MMKSVSISISDYSQQIQRNLHEGLQALLADTYVAQVLAQNMHWNVVGPNFNSLHDMFEGQYSELQSAVDEIAERLRALGYVPVSTLRDFLAFATIAEPDAPAQVEGNTAAAYMLSAYSALTAKAQNVLKFAEASNDTATVDLLTRRILAQDKTAWMLRSLIQDVGSNLQPAE